MMVMVKDRRLRRGLKDLVIGGWLAQEGSGGEVGRSHT
jgi:hypothetical protein